jgi:lysophospholipase L1-like esterase
MINKYLSHIKNKLDKDEWYRVVFLGDSITSTEWVYPNWRGIIEFVLKEKLEEFMGVWEAPWWKLRCYNAGYNGATTKEMIKFIDEDIVLHQPNLIIFMDTDNDKYRGINTEEHSKNLDLIFGKLTKISDNVIFATTIAGLNQEVNDNYQEYIKASDEVINKHKENISKVDLFIEYAKLDLEKLFTFKSISGNEDAGIEPGGVDYAHPNQLGNAYIAKILLKNIFDIEFDAELYIKDTLAGEKYPKY